MCVFSPASTAVVRKKCVSPGDAGLHHGGVQEERVHGLAAERHAIRRGDAGANLQEHIVVVVPVLMASKSLSPHRTQNTKGFSCGLMFCARLHDEKWWLWTYLWFDTLAHVE